MGEADGRNFSCLLHGFPSKLGRCLSFAQLARLEGKKQHLETDSMNTEIQVQLAMMPEHFHFP